MPVRKGTFSKRGSYKIPARVESSFVLASSARGLTDPARANEVIYKAVEKSIKKSGLTKLADDYFNKIVKNWNAKGKDQSRVTFKTKVLPSQSTRGVDIVTTIKGTPLGISRWNMVDSQGRKRGKLISVEGQLTNKKKEIPIGFTEGGYGKEFSMTHTKKGKPRKNAVTYRKLKKLDVTFKDPETGDAFMKNISVMKKKVMPFQEYSIENHSYYKNSDEWKYDPPFGTRAIQGAVVPKQYTKTFLKNHVYGNSRFRKDINNAVRRALRAIKNDKGSTRMAKARVAHKEAKAKAASNAPPPPTQGVYLGKTKGSRKKGWANRRHGK